MNHKEFTRLGVLFGGGTLGATTARALEMQTQVAGGTLEEVHGFETLYGENGFFGLLLKNESILDDIAGISALLAVFSTLMAVWHAAVSPPCRPMTQKEFEDIYID